MLSKWINSGLLDWLGLKLYEEYFDSTTAYHFEIFKSAREYLEQDKDENLHVAFLESRINKNNFNYYFGTFNEDPISPGIETKEQLDRLREKLIAIKKPENRVRASELNNTLLGVLFRNSYMKSIETYYINCWPVSDEQL